MEKGYKTLCFTDNFMFCKVTANNPELCRHMLELILDKPIRKVVIKGTESVMDITPGAKSIRLDVYLDDDAGTVYDLEMQTSAKKNLPKRMRYYQGVMDLNLIEKGDDYDQLPESVVIFICTFDFFDKGLPFYVFENRCEAMPELLLEDGTRKIFVNPYGDCTGYSEDVKKFMAYIRENTAGDTFTEELDKAVEKARSHKEWEVEYMNWRAFEMDISIGNRIAREEGLAEGQLKTLINLVCKKKAKGLQVPEVAEQLESNQEQILQIYKAIDSVGTLDDVDAVYEELMKKKVNNMA